MEKEGEESPMVVIGGKIMLLLMLALFTYMAIKIYSEIYPKEVYCTCSKLTRYTYTLAGRRLVEYNGIDPFTGKVNPYIGRFPAFQFIMGTGTDPQLGTCYLTELDYGWMNINIVGIEYVNSHVPECCDSFVVKKGYCKDVYPQYIHEMRN